jgi:hypothetical protein
MIIRSIGLVCGAALALIPATLAGPASMASPKAPGSAPAAWVVNQSVLSAAKGSVTPIDTATNKVIRSTATNKVSRAIDTGLQPTAIAISR